MADAQMYDRTALGNKSRSHTRLSPRKGDIDLFPEQLTMKCGTFEIQSDGTPQNTLILINGKRAGGIYSLKINFNTQRLTKVEMGVFLNDFDFEVRPKKEGINGNLSS